jgi:hypothetical protein
MLRRLGGAALLGALAYTAADATADTALYLKAKRQAWRCCLAVAVPS